MQTIVTKVTDSEGFDLLCKLIATKFFFFCMKVQGGTVLIPIIYRTKKMPITMKTLGFQMRAAFVALLASACLGAELGREARSLDMVFFFIFGSFCQNEILDIDARENRASN